MPSSDPPRPYRVPASLRDLVMIDLLELTGSTAATAELLNTSQPTVSRRSRAMACDLGLQRQRGAPLGRYRDTPWMRWLRKGVNHHRLAHGVVRVGGAANWTSLFANAPWAEWVPLGLRQQDHWRLLLELEFLDAVAIGNPSELSREESSPFISFELGAQVNGPKILICRQDPLVLEICNRP